MGVCAKRQAASVCAVAGIWVAELRVIVCAGKCRKTGYKSRAVGKMGGGETHNEKKQTEMGSTGPE